MNDVVPQRQLAARSNTKASAQLASKSKRTRRHALIRRRRTTDKKREVNKDKYWLLGFVFLVCMGSYIARHPRIAEFWERLAAAWKGNPIPNQSDTMEDFMITYLLQNPDSEHERWFLRALVAKAGGNPLEGLEPAQYTNDEPIIVDPGESLEGYDGESN